MLRKFVNELTHIDSKERQEILMLEQVGYDQCCKNAGCEPIDGCADFEKAITMLNVPDDLTSDQRRDYITDTIDKSLGINHDNSESCNEDAGDIEEKEKTLVMRKGDYDKLKDVINTYAKTKSAEGKTIIKKFIVAVLNGLKTANKDKPVDAFILASINLCILKLVSEDDKTKITSSESAITDLKIKIKAIAKTL